MKPLILQGALKKNNFFDLEGYLIEASLCSREAIIILINVYFGDEEYIRAFKRLKDEILIPISIVGVGNIANPIFLLGDKRYVMPNSKFSATKVEDFVDIYSEYEIFENGQVDPETLVTGEWEAVKEQLLTIYGNVSLKKPYYRFFGFFDEKNMKNFFEYSFCRAAINKSAVVMLNSPGGEVQCLWVMMGLINALSINLITIGHNLVASCAAEFLMMSDKRYLAPGCKFMVHGSKVDNSKMIDDNLGLTNKEKVENVNYYVILYATCKTRLTKEVILNETDNFSVDWFIPEDKWENFGIVTGSLAEGIKAVHAQL